MALKRMHRRFLLGGALLCLALEGVWAAGAGDLPAKVEAALASTYYQGILVTTRKVGTGREDEVARAWFGPNRKQAVEMVAPSWRGGELLVVDGRNRWLYYPDCEAALCLPAPAEDDSLSVPKGGRVAGTELLNGRQTWVILWEGRLGKRRVWLDAERYVPLKREDRNNAGELVLAQTLTEIEFPASPPLARFQFEPDAGIKVYKDKDAFFQAVSLQHVQRGVDFRLRRPAFLPAGIVFRQALLRELPQLSVVQLKYNNGRDKGFSLFEYQASRTLVPLEKQLLDEAGAGRQGNLNSLRWRLGELEFVLVGNLPPDVLRDVAKSVK